MKAIKKIAGDGYEIIVSIFHFLLSFVWQSQIFLGGGKNWEYFYTIVRNENVISAANELRMVYLLSRIFCLLIIFGFWKIVFFIIKGNVRKSDLVILGSIFFIGLIVGITIFPDYFGLEIDNYANYLSAIRFQPTYWQSIYTGVLYGGCLMVIPHPIALFIVQWTFFCSVVSYIYLGFEKLSDKPICKYIVLLLFLLPDSFELSFNAYRNNYYTVLVLFYISYIYFAIKNHYKTKGLFSIIEFSLYSSFLMVWRSEGVLIGVCGIIIYLLYILGFNRDNIKSICFMLIAGSLGFCILSQAQKFGDKKYYGNDYMIINTTWVLCNILYNDDADLAYEGAEDDLAAIESIVPVQIIKEYGMDGFRSYNWANGRRDYNQSLATDEQASEYMNAYYHIILHNIDLFFDVQRNCFYRALGLPESREIHRNEGEHTIELENYVYDTWLIGQNEVMQTWHTASWENNGKRKALGEIFDNLIGVWKDLIGLSGINVFIHIVSICIVVIILLVELLKTMDNKLRLRFSFPFVTAGLCILMELGAIMVFMPEGRPEYLFPMLYASYLIIYIYLFEVLSAKTKDTRNCLAKPSSCELFP